MIVLDVLGLGAGKERREIAPADIPGTVESIQYRVVAALPLVANIIMLVKCALLN